MGKQHLIININLKAVSYGSVTFGFVLRRFVNLDFVPEIGSNLSLSLTQHSRHEKFTVARTSHSLQFDKENAEYNHTQSQVIVEADYITDDFIRAHHLALHNDKASGYNDEDVRRCLKVFWERCSEGKWNITEYGKYKSISDY